MKQQSDSTGSKRHHSSLSQDLQPEIGLPEVTSSEDFSMSSITSLDKIQRIDKSWKRDLLSFCQQCENDLPDPSLLSHEVDNWDSAWNQCTQNELQESISETLKLTNPISFSNIYTVLKILGVLLITSCTCERSASSIRILKTYLRSTMTQDRLNGLATLYTQKYIKLDLNGIINLNGSSLNLLTAHFASALSLFFMLSLAASLILKRAVTHGGITQHYTLSPLRYKV